MHHPNVKRALQAALDKGELVLEYQPQLDALSGAIVGVEALIRWHSPSLGRMAPADFLPLAGETGLILPIGVWVLRTACAQAKAWQEQGLPGLRVAVNLSAREFMQPNLPPRITEILTETGLAAHSLELEFTETLLRQDIEHAVKTLDALKDLGVSLAIDDFGTGYFNLVHLQSFPIDRLKIDPSLVHAIASDADSQAIGLAVIAMAHSLQLKVVAEGVETEAQQVFLKDQRCDELQGFFSQSAPIAAGRSGAAATSPNAEPKE